MRINPATIWRITSKASTAYKGLEGATRRPETLGPMGGQREIARVQITSSLERIWDFISSVMRTHQRVPSRQSHNLIQVL